MRTIGQIAQFNAKYNPHKKAIVDEGTWREVNERTNRLANALISLGCGKGDRLAILAYNSSEYVECGLATAKAGMVFVLLNFRLYLREIEYILRNSSPKVFFFGKEFSNIADSLKPQFPLHYICLGGEVSGALGYEALLLSAIRMTMTHLQTIKPVCRPYENESYGQPE